MKSLKLVDLDDVEMIMALEEQFNIEISQAQSEKCNTVGDLFEVFKQLLPANSLAGKKCITAMAFYRLRKALRAMGITTPITPKTSITELSCLTPRKFDQQLQSNIDLVIFLTVGTRLTTLGIFLVLFGIFSLFCDFWIIRPWMLSIIAITIGCLLVYFDPMYYRSKTVGDCAKYIAYQNINKLIEQGAGIPDIKLWEAFCYCIAPHSSIDDIDPSQIKPETTLY